ncbi:MAG: aminoacyl-tRNA hydrolase [Gammaproteobacteria bacterium]|nr:MAG: aminoacyl-tRNA hydrolase [Gammaproteobacteria bacterium]
MSEPIRCLVGLGNPGPRYADTRHNVGFWLVDRLARRYGAVLRAENKFAGEVGRIRSEAGECWLLKPMTYMNHSGRSVSAFLHFYKIPPQNLLVAHDELDMAPGVLRLKKGGGHGGHNGLRDIIAATGSKDFWRARIGIGHPGHRDAVVDYVLSRPYKAEQEAIEGALDGFERQWPTIQAGEMQKAMNRLHGSN